MELRLVGEWWKLNASRVELIHQTVDRSQHYIFQMSGSAAYHPHLLELVTKVFNIYEPGSVIAEGFLYFCTFVLYIPSTLVFSGKFFDHCVEQRKKPHYQRQSWLTQFIICVIQQTTGSSTAYILCGKTPNIIKYASFLLPLMFLIWYNFQSNSTLSN